MLEKFKANIPVDLNPIGWDLPTTRANILHIFGQEKTVDYQLDPYYKGIKISPKNLYRLQSAKVNFSMIFKQTKFINIMDGKFIITESKQIDKDSTNHDIDIIKSCIENPINLKNPDQKPNYRKHIEYDGNDCFFLSFNHYAIDGYAQEDFILVTFKEGRGLEAKKIYRAKYASSRKVDVINDNGVPTLKIEYGNPDGPGGNYEEGEYKYEITFNLNDQETKTRNGFYTYRTRNTKRND